jgi:hypothetical protein
MRTLALTALVLATAACIPTVAAGQNVSTDSLLRRIAALERRVGELEALVRVEPSRAVPASLANWRRLRRGMKMDAVRELLGEPLRVETVGVTSWHYANGAQVIFGSDDKVDGWTEPWR